MADGEALESAGTIAGANVEIGADLRNLKIGVADAKQLAGQTERGTRLMIPVQLDTRAMKQQIAALQQEIRNSLSNVTIAAPTLAGPAGQTLAGQTAGTFAGGVVGGAVAGGAQGAGTGAVAGSVGAAATGAVAGAAASRIPGILKTVNAVGAVSGLGAVIPGPVRTLLGAIGGLGPIGIAGVAAGATFAIAQKFIGDWRERQIAAVEEQDKKLAVRHAGTLARQEIERDVELGIAELTGDSGRALAAHQQRRRDKLRQRFVSSGASQRDINLALASEDRLAARETTLERKRQFQIGQAHDEQIAASGARLDADRARLAGKGDEAFELDLVARRQELRTRQAGELVGVDDPKEVRRIEERHAQEEQEDEARANIEREKHRVEVAIDSDTAIAASREANLRLAHNDYEADLVAFDAAAKAKIDAIEDVNAKQNEATRLAAQRSVIVQQQQEQVELSTQGQIVAGTTALLRAQGQDYEAERVELERDFREALKNAQSDQQRAAVRQGFALRYGALETSREQSEGDFRGDQEVRRAQANAVIGNTPEAVGMIGRLGEMARELRNTRIDRLPEVVETQRLELGAMRQEMMIARPGIAYEWDPYRQATGVPSGPASGGLVPELLKLIEAHLKVIRDKEAGLPVVA